MKKSMLAIAFVLASSLAVAQTTPAPAGKTDGNTAAKKHHKKGTKKAAKKAAKTANASTPAK